jgi:hypothetical protein
MQSTPANCTPLSNSRNLIKTDRVVKEIDESARAQYTGNMLRDEPTAKPHCVVEHDVVSDARVKQLKNA